MKTCRTCGNELPTVGVMICPECAEALKQMVAKKVDAQGFSYIEMDRRKCQECDYADADWYDNPCFGCCRRDVTLSRDYFKEAAK